MMKLGELYRKRMAASIKEGVGGKSSAFVVSYSGISSAQMGSLRKDLKRKKAKMMASKTSVARVAFKEANYENLASCLEGQMALILSDAEPSEVSKVLVKFAKDCQGFIVRGGLLNGLVLSQDEIQTLSQLPSREALLAKLLGTMEAPATRFAGALNAKTRDFISILKQKDK